MKARLFQLVLMLTVTYCLPTASNAQTVNQISGNIAEIAGLDTGFTEWGGYICVGKFLPNPNGKHSCRGQLVAASSFAAVYAKGIFDRLSDTNTRLASVEQKLQESAAASEKTRLSVDKIAAQMSEAIQQIVVKRFEILPAELLNDPVVKDRLKRLQEDIIKDIKDSLPKPTDNKPE